MRANPQLIRTQPCDQLLADAHVLQQDQHPLACPKPPVPLVSAAARGLRMRTGRHKG